MIFFSLYDLFYFVIRLCIFLKMRYSIIFENNRRRDFGFQINSFQSPASGKCHIDLPRGETLPSIYDKPVKSESLAFVDGNRPRQTDRQLLETSCDFFFYLFVLSQSVFFLFPDFFFYFQFLIASIQNCENFIFCEAGYFSEFAVVIFSVARGVISDKHHLCADFQFQSFIIWKHIFLKISENRSVIEK